VARGIWVARVEGAGERLHDYSPRILPGRGGHVLAAFLHQQSNRVRAARGLELAVDVLEVRPHGVRAEHELLRDRGGGVA